MKKLLHFSAVLFSLAFISCFGVRTPHTFRVGLRSLPQRIDPRNNEVNVFHYIILHLYFPLFDKISTGAIISNFLDMETTHAKSPTFRQYQLCLKPDAKFSDGTPISASHLETTIKFSHRKNMELNPFSELRITSSRCLEIILTEPDPRYFHKLASIQSTILKIEPSEQAQVPIGLGPYMIQKMTDSKITLISSALDGTEYFKKIEFIKVETPKDGLDAEIHDWNQLWPHQGDDSPIPASVKASAKVFQQNLFRSLMLVINIKDSALRKRMNACIDRIAYKKALGLKTTATSGYLPLGLSGNAISYEEIKNKWKVNPSNCRPKVGAPEVPFYIFYPQLESRFRTFFATNQDRLPVRVTLKLVSVSEAIKHLFGREELILQTMADTMRASSTGFFTTMIGEERVLIEEPTGLEALVKLAASNGKESEAEALFQRAHELLLKSGQILPLGQVQATYYFPNFITEIPLVDPANGFPMINHLRVD